MPSLRPNTYTAVRGRLAAVLAEHADDEHRVVLGPALLDLLANAATAGIDYEERAQRFAVVAAKGTAIVGGVSHDFWPEDAVSVADGTVDA